MFKKIRKRKKLVPILMCMAFLCVAMSVSVFATSEAPGVSDILTDLGTVVDGYLGFGESVFSFITSSAVLPWILMGVGVSIIGVCIFWAKWLIWGR